MTESYRLTTPGIWQATFMFCMIERFHSRGERQEEVSMSRGLKQSISKNPSPGERFGEHCDYRPIYFRLALRACTRVSR